MKTKIITLLFLNISLFVFSQEVDYYCATPDDNAPDPQGMHSYAIDPPDIATLEPLVLNVKFWKVNGPNGEFYGNFSEDHTLEGIAELNLIYNQFNIFFKYRGWEELDSPTNVVDYRYEDGDGDGDKECITYPNPDPEGFSKLELCQLGAFWSFVGSNYFDPTSINVYITSWNINFGGAAQFIGANKIVLGSGSLIDDKGLIHEMGHALGLKHTRSSGEHVTRDPNDTVNFNATLAGDRVVDTAANPGFRDTSCSPSTDPSCYPYVLAGCTYDQSSLEEDNSTPPSLYKEEIDHEDVINVMGDAYVCMENYLSPGQGVRIREKIQNLSVLQAALTDVPALYEPYSGEYYFAGPFDPILHRPLMQPGFDYIFVECTGNFPQPAGYNVTFNYNNNSLLSIDEDELNYNLITHPNHSAIKIKGTQVFDPPRKCYNNFNRNPKGGSITKFNDGILNTNVTISPQDSTAINNPNLIQNLDNGLYKIEKAYDDGAVQETVIQKGNN